MFSPFPFLAKATAFSSNCTGTFCSSSSSLLSRSSSTDSIDMYDSPLFSSRDYDKFGCFTSSSIYCSIYRSTSSVNKIAAFFGSDFGLAMKKSFSKLKMAWPLFKVKLREGYFSSFNFTGITPESPQCSSTINKLWLLSSLDNTYTFCWTSSSLCSCFLCWIFSPASSILRLRSWNSQDC
jgi:hypothetical protein